jgi:hypothetical protein
MSVHTHRSQRLSVMSPAVVEKESFISSVAIEAISKLVLIALVGTGLWIGSTLGVTAFGITSLIGTALLAVAELAIMTAKVALAILPLAAIYF